MFNCRKSVPIRPSDIQDIGPVSLLLGDNPGWLGTYSGDRGVNARITSEMHRMILEGEKSNREREEAVESYKNDAKRALLFGV